MSVTESSQCIEARINDSRANGRGHEMLSIARPWRTTHAADRGHARTSQAVNPASSRLPHPRRFPAS